MILVARIAAALFVIDWILGALIVARVLPWWTFPVVNLPFGFIYTWLESDWTGSSYVVNGRFVSDSVAMLTLPATVLPQAMLYAAVCRLLRHRKVIPTASL
jgi:hypothetical protein